MNRFSNIPHGDINSGKYVFRNVFEVYDYLQKEKGWKIGWYTAPYFEVMQIKTDQLVSSPIPMNPLFRGQNCFYELSYPSLYRKNMSQLDMIERDIKLEDFKSILKANPEIKDNINAGLLINYIGLAQHYGIETNIMDLTNSFGVAVFLLQHTMILLGIAITQFLGVLLKGLFISCQQAVCCQILIEKEKNTFCLLVWRLWHVQENNGDSEQNF